MAFDVGESVWLKDARGRRFRAARPLPTQDAPQQRVFGPDVRSRWARHRGFGRDVGRRSRPAWQSSDRRQLVRGRSADDRLEAPLPLP